MDLQQALEVIKSHADYRVLQRIPAPGDYKPVPEGIKTYLMTFLDTETTGFEFGQDKIIEINLTMVEFDMDGNFYGVRDAYDGFEDPGFPLSDEVKTVTGLKDEDLAGQSLDDDAISNIIRQSAVMVAHNASFDRQMMEHRFPETMLKRWGCTLKDVDWGIHGVNGLKLSNIAASKGFFFEAHRAAVDVHAMIHMLATPDDPDLPKSSISQLLDAVGAKTYLIYAVGAPFETKDCLKANGFSWSDGADGRPKAWYREAKKEDLTEVANVLNEAYLIRPGTGRTLENTAVKYGLVDSTIRYSSQRPELVPAGTFLNGFLAETDDDGFSLSP